MDTATKEKVRDILFNKIDRQMLLYMDICARCGICKDACHVYSSTKNPKHMPAYRAEVLRRIYKKYTSWLGKHLPALYKAREIDDDALDELYDATYSCTGCRRCTLYCPYGIDVPYVLSTAKAMLIAAGKAPEVLDMLADAAVEKGNCIEDFKEIIIGQLQELEPELRKRTGMPEATIPVGKQGADMLYVALSGTHSIFPAAIIFNLAKENWTLSMFEAANYGFLVGDAQRARLITKRIIDEATALGVKEIVVTECGHAYRVMKYLYEYWSGGTPPFKISSIFEPFARYISESRIKVDPDKIKEPVAYHDPCQLGRNGGIFEEPRHIIRSITRDYREMSPNRGENWCCGGGGGLVALAEMEDYRADSAKIKAEQIAASGASLIATPCENCRLQLALLNERYNLNIKISAVMDLLADAVMPID